MSPRGRRSSSICGSRRSWRGCWSPVRRRPSSVGECVRCLEPIDDEMSASVPGAVRVRRPGHHDATTRTTRSAGSRATCSTSSRCCGTRWCLHCRSSRCVRTTVRDCASSVVRAWRTIPDHTHEAAIDPRWAILEALEAGRRLNPMRTPRPAVLARRRTVAVPKRKMSRSNTRHRRSQWKAVAPSLVTCANPACGAKHLPHRACGECGQYGAKADRRQVL